MKKLMVFLGMCALVLGLIGMAGADAISNAVVVRPIPEPATLVLFGSGLIGLAAVMRKIKKK